MSSRSSRGFALAGLVPLALASCAKKEPPPQQAPTTVAASVAPTITTLPPPPTAPPTPPLVWRTTRWGMTKKEVLAALPGEAQRLDKIMPFAQPQPGSSIPAGSSDVEIPTYEIEGTKFRVLFGFDGDALNRVHLSALKAGAATCDDMEKMLTAAHSAPSQRGTTGTSLKGQEITWSLPDQTIVLGCAGVRSLGFLTVTLDYMAPGPAQPGTEVGRR